MKSITALGLLAAAVSAQQLDGKRDFEKGRTREQIGRTSIIHLQPPPMESINDC
jgi:hypothetical protein